MKRWTKAAVVAMAFAASVSMWIVGWVHRTGASKGPDVRATESLAPRDGGTLTIGQSGKYSQAFIPQLMSDLYTWNIDAFAYDPLFTIDSHLHYTPDLVTAWAWSADKKTVTLTLSSQAKWSDGMPITADDVLFTMDVLASKTYNDTLKGQYGYVVSSVAGVDQVLNNGKSFAQTGGFRKLDDNHFEITFQSPDAAVLWSDLAGLVPIPKHALQQIPMTNWPDSSFNHQPTVVSGPYRFDKVDGQHEVDMSANPAYFRGTPHIRRVVWETVDGKTAATALQSGSLGLQLQGLDLGDRAKLDALSNVRTRLEGEMGYEYLGFKLYQKEFQDVRVRQAFMYALDRAALVKDVLGGNGRVLDTPVAADSWAAATKSDGVNGYPYDPDRANQLLDAAGWKTGADGWRVDPVTKKTAHLPLDLPAGNPRRVAVAKAIADDLAKVHVHVDVRTPQDFDALSKKVESDDKGIYLWLMGWSLGVDPDPRGSWGKDDVYNFPRWNDAKNETLMKKTYGLDAFDTDSRRKALVEWQAYINQQLPCVFLYQPDDLYALNRVLHIPAKDWTNLGPINPQDWWLETNT